MSENRTKQGPADANQVNVSEAAEVEYWRKKYGCTEAQLRHAVAAVGPSAGKVKQYLKNKSTPPKGKAQRFE